MFREIKKASANLNTIARRIILHGMQLACGIATIGIMTNIHAQTLTQWEESQGIMTIAITIFGLSLIFGLACNRLIPSEN